MILLDVCVCTFMLAVLTPTTRKRCAWSLYSSRSAPSRGAAAPPWKPDPVEIICGQYGHRPKHSNIIVSSLKFLSKVGFVSFFSSKFLVDVFYPLYLIYHHILNAFNFRGVLNLKLLLTSFQTEIVIGT